MIRRFLFVITLILLSSTAHGGVGHVVTSRPVKACAEGAVTKACKCGGTKVTTGYCCSGAAQASACAFFPDAAGTITTHVTFNGSALVDSGTGGCQWTAVGAPTMVAATGDYPAGASNWATTRYYQCNPNGNGNDPLDYTGDYWCGLVYSPTTASAGIPFSDGQATASGWTANIGPLGSVGYYTSTTGVFTAGIATLDTPNMLLFGRNVNSGMVMMNGGSARVLTDAAHTAATTLPARLGNYSFSVNYPFVGTIYEAICRPEAPTEATMLETTRAFVTRFQDHAFVALGDSLTYGTTYGNTTHPSELVKILGAGWIAANRGVVARQTNAILTDWTTNVRGMPYRYVEYLGGTNDINQTSMTETQIFANIEPVVDQAVADGQRVLLFTVPPCGGFANCTAPRNAVRIALNGLIAAKAASLPSSVALVDLDAVTNNGSDALWPSMDYGDHAHLNNLGLVTAGQTAYAAGQAKGWWP